MAYHAKFLWTAGTFGLSAGLKFGLNIALAWLLAPEILGILLVVNAVRLGIELLTDVGIEQNMVHHPDGLDQRFRDTAWTLQLLRGALLSLVFLAASPALSSAYGIDLRIFLLVSLSPLISGLHSTAIFVLVKNLEVRQRNAFELICEGLAFALQITLALSLRSVWAPVFGLLGAVAIRSALSYALPHARQRLRFDRTIVLRILDYGKWIALTSLVMYAASNLDRLYLGKVAPLALVGIYGIARAIAELPTTLARRMSYQIIFPALVGMTPGDQAERLAGLARTRLLFVVGVCGALAFGAAIGDLLIALVYDVRYAAAGWMLSVLLLGALFASLSNLNEALLLGAGKPLYSSLANLARLASLAGLLPLGFSLAGFAGAVLAVASVEALHYGYIALGQVRVKAHYFRHDALALLLAALVFCAMLVGRDMLGLGSALSGLWGAMP